MQLQLSKLLTQLQASPSWDAQQSTDIVPEKYLWRALQFQQFVKDTPEVGADEARRLTGRSKRLKKQNCSTAVLYLLSSNSHDF
jgi:hypothetical protein